MRGNCTWVMSMVLFFRRLPHPPTTTLFPYTTLFRSSYFSLLTLFPAILVLIAAADAFLGSIDDRKSTRLNSSHRCISYAVFCLKKKKLVGEGLDTCTKSVTTAPVLTDTLIG